MKESIGVPELRGTRNGDNRDQDLTVIDYRSFLAFFIEAFMTKMKRYTRNYETVYRTPLDRSVYGRASIQMGLAPGHVL